MWSKIQGKRHFLFTGKVDQGTLHSGRVPKRMLIFFYSPPIPDTEFTYCFLYCLYILLDRQTDIILILFQISAPPPSPSLFIKQARNPGTVQKRIANSGGRTDGTDGTDRIDRIDRIDGIDGTDRVTRCMYVYMYVGSSLLGR